MRLLTAFLLLLVGNAGAGRQQPNVILILADDFGYECLGANGGTSYQTPVLDHLAATGMRFGHCHVQPLCTPTRVQLMSGIYNVRNYLTFGTMDPASYTFANAFRQAGYATAVVGKWQLGQDPNLPAKFGFDEFCLWQHTRRPPRYANPGLEINGAEKDYHSGEYGPDIVNDYAIDFVTRHKDHPFLLYYPMMLTHAPYQPTPDSRDWDPKRKGEKGGASPQHFGEMVAYMDKLVGKLVSRLDDLGLREDTMLVFLGDNGTGQGTKSRMGDRIVTGGKGKMTAAGTHVPLIVNWPGRVAQGRVCVDLIDSVDLLPTICAATGTPWAGERVIDGRSFWPQLQGEPGEPRAWRYSWYGPHDVLEGEFAATRNFKLYRDGRFFDLRADPEELLPMAEASLQAGSEAATAAGVLQQALAGFARARPLEMAKPLASQQPTGKKKRKAPEPE